MTDQPILRFHGAAECVTGSCHMVELAGHRVLIDCGMFQGSKTEKELNYRPFPFDPRAIDALILTHAHIDHSGLIPKLVKDGFTGPIFTTSASTDLCAVMLPDSAHIQEFEVENLNHRNRRRGRAEVTPIYDQTHVVAALRLFRSVPLGTWLEAAPGIRFRLWNAGHLLGSASIELQVGLQGEPLKLLFSGDIGPDNKLLERDPEGPAALDYIITESTYGDTDRQEVDDKRRRGSLRAEVKAAINPGGVLLIPSFAVERTQELLTDLVSLMDRDELPATPIFIDSPLADRASHVFQKHAWDLEHGEMLGRAMRSHNVHFTQTLEQSKALDNQRGFHIVIAASGMCEAGRIRHRLRNWLWREEATVLLVGYQAAGTLGRLLDEGAQQVRIQGDDIQVRARIRKLDLYSGHADGPELATWVKKRQPVAAGVFMIHGEDPALEGLRQRLAEFLPREKILQPRLDSAFRLTRSEAVDISETAPPPRIDPVHAGRMDWHNDVQSLLIDIHAELAKAADAKARGVILRRLKRALAAE
ncbi:MBL fold metallo-hydrolase RNA specificity domain-containing protein [Oryzibacter oryziterrae]|uniref:MBL fold metallo-hydrolase RNA specificity domain-containing protein n=1 Tax=Oryzibacter oryziterrae TaxID=2766474 RepID=UPI001F43445E|nr:MBL fold metallo-hydrolase [Oryzibacter oryziterrae]